MSKICEIILSADVFTTKQNLTKHSTVPYIDIIQKCVLSDEVVPPVDQIEDQEIERKKNSTSFIHFDSTSTERRCANFFPTVSVKKTGWRCSRWAHWQSLKRNISFFQSFTTWKPKKVFRSLHSFLWTEHKNGWRTCSAIRKKRRKMKKFLM